MPSCWRPWPSSAHERDQRRGVLLRPPGPDPGRGPAAAGGGAEAYFAAFSPQATFIFHPEAHRLGARSAYRTCRVATTVQVHRDGGRDTSDERETIIFSRTPDGGIVCVHEHLPACPQ